MLNLSFISKIIRYHDLFYPILPNTKKKKTRAPKHFELVFVYARTGLFVQCTITKCT